MITLNHTAEIRDLAERGALFVLSHSGGKDSQAMFVLVSAMVPADQVLVMHADLSEVDWPGTLEHIKATTAGYDLIVAKSVSSFWDTVERRGMFPSPKYRQCTSDLKRTPIEREVRRYLAANPRFGGLVIMCDGRRAEESSARAKLATFKPEPAKSKNGRTWFTWLPIFELTEIEVFQVIAEAGESPHWAYGEGMSRLSCCFCIMASRSDLCTAARLNPELYSRYVETEKRLDHTLLMPRSGHAPRGLEEITGVAARPERQAAA